MKPLLVHHQECAVNIGYWKMDGCSDARLVPTRYAHADAMVE